MIEHLSTDEPELRYRQAHDPVGRVHWPIIWLLAQSQSVATIAKATRYSPIWTDEILYGYNERDPDGVGDQRPQNPGQPLRIPPNMREKLDHPLNGPSRDGSRWTSKKGAVWLTTTLGVAHVHIPRGWNRLRQLGYRPTAPHPYHPHANAETQTVGKKARPSRIAAIQAAHPVVTPCALRTIDEHRIGRKPILRPIWAPRGERLTAAPRAFSQALAQRARLLGLGQDKPRRLVLDRVDWHTRKRLGVPAGIHLLFQPAYAPEGQPAEQLWALTNAALANVRFEPIDVQLEAPAMRCEQVRPRTRTFGHRPSYHGWPRLTEAELGVEVITQIWYNVYWFGRDPHL